MTKKSKTNHPQFKGLDLSFVQEDFVYFYCHPDYGYNATRAYAKAYNIDLEKEYNSAKVSGSRLLTRVDIMDAVDIERKRRLESHEDLAKFVMGEWYKIAQTDVTQIMDIVGPSIKLKSVEEIPQHLRGCIKSIKMADAGVVVTFHDKTKALDSLAKALGMFIERVQNVNEGYESLVDKIEKKRAKKKAEKNGK